MSQHGDSSQANTADDVGTCYRLQRYYLAIGAVCTLFFLLVGVWSTCAAYWNVDGSFDRPKLFALISGVFWSCWTLLGLWQIALYFRYRLHVNRLAITEASVFRVKTIPVSDVVRVVWRTIPARGSVVLYARNAKLRIGLSPFTAEERRELIRFCRDTWDERAQEDWPRFIEHFKEETFGYTAADMPGPKRRSFAASAAVNLTLIFSAPCFLYFWSIGFGVENLIGAVLIVLFYLWKTCSWAVRKRGN